MATTSEVKTGMDAIAATIANARAVVIKAKANVATAKATLDALPTAYADVLSTINAYGTTDAFEANTKAELAKLTAEFTDLGADCDAIAAVQV
jgi:hypothetical protein